MKAAPDAQARLSALTDVDTTLVRLAHRRSGLPEQADLDGLVAEHRAAGESAARARIAVEDIDRAMSKLEGDIDAVRRRRQKDEAAMTSGSLPAKQVSELDHELGTLARRQDELEAEELELMERREALAADVDHSGATVADLANRIEEATRLRDAALSDLDDEEAAARNRRAEAAEGVPDELLGLYTRLLEETGRGAGMFTGGRCTACGMELDRSSVSAILAASDDEVVQCPECRAILVRGTSAR